MTPRPLDIGRLSDLYSCADCHDRGWVCELHEHEPWPHEGCPGQGAVCGNPDCIFRGAVRPADRHRAPYRVSDDDTPMADHCFLYEAGVATGQPCWGALTPFPRVVPMDEGGSQPGDIWLCAGHAPVYRGAPYARTPR